MAENQREWYEIFDIFSIDKEAFLLETQIADKVDWKLIINDEKFHLFTDFESVKQFIESYSFFLPQEEYAKITEYLDKIWSDEEGQLYEFWVNVLVYLLENAHSIKSVREKWGDFADEDLTMEQKILFLIQLGNWLTEFWELALFESRERCLSRNDRAVYKILEDIDICTCNQDNINISLINLKLLLSRFRGKFPQMAFKSEINPLMKWVSWKHVIDIKKLNELDVNMFAQLLQEAGFPFNSIWMRSSVANSKEWKWYNIVIHEETKEIFEQLLEDFLIYLLKEHYMTQWTLEHLQGLYGESVNEYAFRFKDTKNSPKIIRVLDEINSLRAQGVKISNHLINACGWLAPREIQIPTQGLHDTTQQAAWQLLDTLDK